MPEHRLLTAEETDSLLERVGALAERHAAILEEYWNPTRATFCLESAREEEDHVTTACTCVLSFLDSPGCTLPKYFTDHRTQFVDWLLSAPWKSEDLPDPNTYTAPLAVTTLRHLRLQAL